MRRGKSRKIGFFFFFSPPRFPDSLLRFSDFPKKRLARESKSEQSEHRQTSKLAEKDPVAVIK